MSKKCINFKYKCSVPVEFFDRIVGLAGFAFNSVLPLITKVINNDETRCVERHAIFITEQEFLNRKRNIEIEHCEIGLRSAKAVELRVMQQNKSKTEGTK